MTTIKELLGRVEMNRPLLEDEIMHWANASDFSRARIFYGSDLEEAKRAVARVSDILVTKYLNNPNTSEVPLDNKSRVCLILNNFALYKPVRACIFDVLDKLGAIFEESMREDGTTPFNPDLGRMTEHVAVLLMRVTGYKLKASNLLELADGNAQFSIQLLLAILLKEPVYELALRCNCMTIILGFTQPQAFFGSSEKLEETSCLSFTKKIDFMLVLLLRLKAVQVLSDTLYQQLCISGAITPLLHVSICSVMRCVMNIFRFSSEGSTQWRQHILLSTTLLDQPVSMYLSMQCGTLRKALEASDQPLNIEMLRGIALGFKFVSLCTFRLHHHAKEARVFFPFLDSMLRLSIRHVTQNSAQSDAIMRMYISMFHLMANIDALHSDTELPRDLPPQMLSVELLKAVDMFLRREVATGGLTCLRAWHTALRTVEPDTLVDRSSPTFLMLEQLFVELLATTQQQQEEQKQEQQQELKQEQQQERQQVCDTALEKDKRRILGDIPPLRSKPIDKKVSIENAAVPVDTRQHIGVVKSSAIEGVNPILLCALTGNVMKNPVSSPHGHTYEQEAILAWLGQNGSVCPLTGKPLTAESLTPNKKVATLIMREVIQQSMTAYNQEDEADLYEF